MKQPPRLKCTSLSYIVRAMEARNRAENSPISERELRRHKRIELLNQHPDLTDWEVEVRIDRIMARGSKPTTSTALPTGVIPAEVRQARDDARREIARRRKGRK
jgi:hypothetical protein